MSDPDAVLATPQAASLRRAIDRSADALVALLEAPDEGPWAALAVLVGQDPDDVLPGPVMRCSTRQRARALAARTLLERQSAAWAPFEWDADEVDVEVPEELDDDALAVLERIVPADIEPQWWFAEAVCHAVMRGSVGNTTEEFVAYPTDGYLTSEVLRGIERVAPPAVLERLIAEDLLDRRPADHAPRPSDFGTDLAFLEDGPPLPEDLRAHLEHAVELTIDALTERLREDGPWAALALVPFGADAPLPGSFALCPPAARARAVAYRRQDGGAEAFHDRCLLAWTPQEWDPDITDPEDSRFIAFDWPWDAAADASRTTLMEQLARAGLRQPSEWVAREACVRLNRRSLANVTDDFLAYPTTGADQPHQLMATFLRVATAKHLRTLVDQRLALLDSRALDALYH